MVKRAWGWWKEAKDVCEAVVLAAAVAVIIFGLGVAFVSALRTLSLGWQIALIIALGVLVFSLLRILYNIMKRIPYSWNPLREQRSIDCELEHVTAEQRQLLGWAGGQARHDIERTKEYVKASVTIDLLGIYSLSDPIVAVHFDVSSSAMYRVIVGDEIRGHIKSYQILGDVPKNELDGNGSKEVLSLLRGEARRLTLEQHISTDLRNNWIRNHLEKEIPFYLKNLFVSVQLANPYIAGIVHQGNLEYQTNVSAILPRIMDWDESELKKIVDAQS